MAYRQIQGLKWASPCERPQGIPKSRPRGAKAAGLRYEKALAKALPAAKHGQWFEFEDRNGRGWCQTDLLLIRDHEVVILEAKYTWTQEGHFQVNGLYRPVVEIAFGKPAVGVVVCKVLTQQTPREGISGTMEGAVLAWRTYGHGIWHWLGMKPPRLRPSAASLGNGHLAGLKAGM